MSLIDSTNNEKSIQVDRQITDNDRFTLLITTIFAVVAGIGIYHHEMWRDELEIFMKMRDTPSFSDLFPNILAIPNIYYSLLFLIIKIFPCFEAFQIFHFLVIVAAVYIFNRFSPFSIINKILFTFSYFVLFEYGMISREYSMLLLFLFLTVFLVTKKQKSIIAISIALILLATHHLYGVFFSFSILIYYLMNLTGNKLKDIDRKKIVTAIIILLIGGIVVLLQLYFLKKFNRFEFSQAPFLMTIRTVWNSFFPIPNTPGPHFWETNIFAYPKYYFNTTVFHTFGSSGNILSIYVSIVILFIGLITFSKKKAVLCSFSVNLLLHFSFLQFAAVYFIRYQGPIFLIFLYSTWLFRNTADDLSTDRDNRFFSFINPVKLAPFVKLYDCVLTAALVIQFFCGIFAWRQDIKYPFTSSYETSNYIVEHNLDDLVLVGYVDYTAQAIAAHLKKNIYYPQISGYGTYVNWMNKNRKSPISLQLVIDSSIQLADKYKKDVLLILNFPIMTTGNTIPLNNELEMRFLNKFTNSILEDERYFLYRVQFKN